MFQPYFFVPYIFLGHSVNPCLNISSTQGKETDLSAEMEVVDRVQYSSFNVPRETNFNSR